jgi:hypothetical protein
MHVNHRDLCAGAVFIGIGALFGLNAGLTLRIGEAQAMGPGYFPIVLGAALAGLGLAIAVGAFGKTAERFGQISWRGVILVAASIFFFAMTVRGLGLAPALAIATLLAGLSSGRLSLTGAVLLAVGMTAFCVLLFVYALRLPYAVFGPWLTG